MSICANPIKTGFSRDFSTGKSFNFSEWNPIETYYNDSFKQDFVKYNGDLYVCIKTNTNEIPVSSYKWMLVLEKLKGETGERGEDGNRILFGKENVFDSNITGAKKGDLYINILNGNVFELKDSWFYIGTIIGGGESNTSVSFAVEQDLTPEDQSRARANINAASKEDIPKINWKDF